MSKKRFARLGAAFLAAVLLLTTTVTTVFATGGVKFGRTVTISFNLDLEKGTTDDFEGNSWSIPSVPENYVSEIVVPTVTAYEGYEFTGWQVDGDKTTTYSHAELVGLFASGKIADLAYFGEGASDGYVTISALFNEDKPVVE